MSASESTGLKPAPNLSGSNSREAELGTVNNGPDDVRAAQLCGEAMRIAASVAGEVATPTAVRASTVAQREAQGSPGAEAASDATAASIEEALPRLVAVHHPATEDLSVRNQTRWSLRKPSHGSS